MKAAPVTSRTRSSPSAPRPLTKGGKIWCIIFLLLSCTCLATWFLEVYPPRQLRGSFARRFVSDKIGGQRDSIELGHPGRSNERVTFVTDSDPESLLRRAHKGDGEALGRLLESYRNYLTLLARL